MTEFYLATAPKDFKACHEILDKLGRKAEIPLSFPTIVGKRNGKIVAFISTRNLKKAKAVVVGELGVDPAISRPQFILLKLLETYDAFLLSKGVVSYLACIPVENQRYLDIIKEVAGIEPYTRDSEFAWINRRLI